jgi:hypothetical protein
LDRSKLVTRRIWPFRRAQPQGTNLKWTVARFGGVQITTTVSHSR